MVGAFRHSAPFCLTRRRHKVEPSVHDHSQYGFFSLLTGGCLSCDNEMEGSHPLRERKSRRVYEVQERATHCSPGCVGIGDAGGVSCTPRSVGGVFSKHECMTSQYRRSLRSR